MTKLQWGLAGVSILVFLYAFVIMPPVPAVREAAPRSRETNNLKQIGLAFHIYYEKQGSFPLAKKHQQSKLSWRVHLLPYLDEKALYEKFQLEEPWDSPHNLKLVSEMPSFYRCPGSKRDDGKTPYLAVVGPGTIMENGGGKTYQDVPDGTQNTVIAVGVEDAAAVIWTKPADYTYHTNNPAAQLTVWHGGFLAIFADGTVKHLLVDTPAQTLLNLYQRNDGNQVAVEDF